MLKLVSELNLHHLIQLNLKLPLSDLLHEKCHPNLHCVAESHLDCLSHPDYLRNHIDLT